MFEWGRVHSATNTEKPNKQQGHTFFGLTLATSKPLPPRVGLNLGLYCTGKTHMQDNRSDLLICWFAVVRCQMKKSCTVLFTLVTLCAWCPHNTAIRPKGWLASQNFGTGHCPLSLLSNISNVNMNKNKHMIKKWIIWFVKYHVCI